MRYDAAMNNIDVSREMLNAAHRVTMDRGFVLGHELLTEIYKAMRAAGEQQGKKENTHGPEE